MADIAIRITGKADQALREIQRVSGAVQSLRTQVTSAMAAIRSAAQMALAYLGARGLAGSLQTATQAALRQATAEKRLELALRQTGDVTGAGAAEIKRYAAELQKVTGVGDEVTIQAAAQAVALTGLTGPALKQAIALSHDLAAVTGEDVTGAMMALSKALVDPADGLSRLRRAGVMLSDQQVEQIRIIQQTQGLYAAQQALLELLTQRVGGMAAATATPMQILKSHVGDLIEKIGEQLLPYVQGLAQLVLENLPEITDRVVSVGKAAFEWIVTLAKIAAAWKVVTTALQAYAAAKAFVVALTGKGLLLVAAAAAAAGAAYVALDHYAGKATVAVQNFGQELKEAAARAEANKRANVELASSLRAVAESRTLEAEARKRLADAITGGQKLAESPTQKLISGEAELQRSLASLKLYADTYDLTIKRLRAVGLGEKVEPRTVESWKRLAQELRPAVQEYQRLLAGTDAIRDKLVDAALGGAASKLRAIQDELAAMRLGMSDAEREAWQLITPLQAAAIQLQGMGGEATKLAPRLAQLAEDLTEAFGQLEAEKIRQSLLSAEQRFLVRQRQLERLVQTGALTPEEAVEALARERERPMAAATLGVMTRGAEFYRALAEAMAQSEAQQDEERWRREMLRHLQEIAHNTRGEDLVGAEL